MCRNQLNDKLAVYVVIDESRAMLLDWETRVASDTG